MLCSYVASLRFLPDSMQQMLVREASMIPFIVQHTYVYCALQHHNIIML